MPSIWRQPAPCHFNFLMYTIDFRIHRGWKTDEGFGRPRRGYQEQEVPFYHLLGKSLGTYNDQVLGTLR